MEMRGPLNCVKISQTTRNDMLTFEFRRMLIPSAVMALLFVWTTGCEQLPGTPKQQGAAVGAVGGAVAGAAIGGEDHRVLGAILGGALGAGGGYVIGANSDRILNRDKGAAEDAMRNAQTAPASPEQARIAPTADLNNDGFVTMDEVVAMRQAGLPDQVILERMGATGQVFELTPDQERYLRDRGVSDYVVGQMHGLNRDVRDRLLSDQTSGRPVGQ
jgi:uncharacterized membrane protein